MFHFQKEVILNSLDKAAVIAAHNGIDAKVRFHDGGEYFAKYVVDDTIYKTAPIQGTPFELTLKMADALLDQHIQILIELGLDNDYRADYSSAVFYFRKPILVDVQLPKTAAEAAKVIYSAIKAVIPAEYNFVTVEKPGTTTNNVVVKGADSYQKVRKLVITAYTCDTRCEGSSEVPTVLTELSGDELVNGNSFASYTANNPEFGTYEYIIHNLRLPTYENVRFTSPNVDEMPSKGTKYYQYSFAYCVPRGIQFGGVSVAGQTNHSTTLHTFYVAESLVTNFEKLFTDAGVGSFVSLARKGKHNVTILPDAYASSQDLKNTQQTAKNKAAIKAAHTSAEV